MSKHKKHEKEVDPAAHLHRKVNYVVEQQGRRPYRHLADVVRQIMKSYKKF